MKNTMRKIGLLFAVLIMAMLFTVSANADSYEDYNFIELSNGSLEITQYVGSKIEICIPSEIDGKNVTSIASYAFSGCSTIEKVVFPDCITKLGKNIFSGCTKLTSINLPKNLKTCLYDHSVSSYTSAAGAIIYKHYYYGPFASSNIINVVVPEGLVHIPEYTFYGCSTIENIIFPSSIKTIGAYAFYNTNKLNNVYYTGTNDDFLDIQINANNSYLLNAKWLINHNHIYSSFVLVKPTCSLPGKIKYVCECSAEYIETVEATGHNYVEEITVVATCKNDGLKTYTCSCGDSYIEKISKLSEHSYTSVTTEATCSTEGFTTHTCMCGDTFTDNYLPLKNHSYSTYVLYKTETCTSDRALRSYCDYGCGKIITVRVKNTQLHHNYIIISNSKDATCTEDGHTESKKCTLCGSAIDEIVVPAKGHSHNAIATAPTCTSKGYTTYTCECGDSYISDYVNALGHKDSNGDYKCDNGCGYEYEKPADDTPSENCSCNCHAGGIKAFFFKLINFFQKLFGKNKVCACGVAH